MVIAGLAVPRALDREGASGAPSRSSVVLGSALFLATYVIDVAGVARGADSTSYRGARGRQGLWSSASYRFLDTDGIDVSSALGVRAGWDARRLWLEGGTAQDVALRAAWYDARAGAWLWRQEGSESGAFLEGRGEWLDLDLVAPLRRYSASGEVGGAIDLGTISAGLRRAWAGGRLGYVRRWYALPIAERVEDRARIGRGDPALRVGPRTGGLIAGLFGGVALSDAARVIAAYERRDGEVLHDIGPGWGVISGAIEYQADEKLELQVLGEYGSGLGVTLGLRYWIYEPGRSRSTRSSARTSRSSSHPGTSDQGALTRRSNPWRESTSAARSSGKVK